MPEHGGDGGVAGARRLLAEHVEQRDVGGADADHRRSSGYRPLLFSRARGDDLGRPRRGVCRRCGGSSSSSSGCWWAMPFAALADAGGDDDGFRAVVDVDLRRVVEGPLDLAGPLPDPPPDEPVDVLLQVFVQLVVHGFAPVRVEEIGQCRYPQRYPRTGAYNGASPLWARQM